MLAFLKSSLADSRVARHSASVAQEMQQSFDEIESLDSHAWTLLAPGMDLAPYCLRDRVARALGWVLGYMDGEHLLWWPPSCPLDV